MPDDAAGLRQGSVACVHRHHEPELRQGQQDRHRPRRRCSGGHARCHAQRQRRGPPEGNHMHQEPQQRRRQRCSSSGNPRPRRGAGPCRCHHVLSQARRDSMHHQRLPCPHEPFHLKGQQAPGLPNGWSHGLAHVRAGTYHVARFVDRGTHQGVLRALEPCHRVRQQDSNVQLPRLRRLHPERHPDRHRRGADKGVLHPLEFRGRNEEPSPRRDARRHPPGPRARRPRRRHNRSPLQVRCGPDAPRRIARQCHPASGVRSTRASYGHPPRRRSRPNAVEGTDGIVVRRIPDEHRPKRRGGPGLA
mmetsp:Transcript_22877/g.64792  ORF Transcript_22877/g.64792 Transcript_22877/m.64792 type:complete len:304 (-) Transcript_22877:1235-2146(-)